MTWVKDDSTSIDHTAGGVEVKVSKAKSESLIPGTVSGLSSLVAIAPEAIVSRVLAKTSGGSVTLFAFAAGQELSEHTAPFDALVQVVDGDLEVTVGGEPVRLGPNAVVLMPADVPHALRAEVDSRMVLVMLREQ